MPIKFVYGIASKQCHRSLNFGTQQTERSFDTGLPTCRQRVHVASTNAACIRSQCERFDDMIAAANSTVTDDIKPVA